MGIGNGYHHQNNGNGFQNTIAMNEDINMRTQSFG